MNRFSLHRYCDRLHTICTNDAHKLLAIRQSRGDYPRGNNTECTRRCSSSTLVATQAAGVPTTAHAVVGTTPTLSYRLIDTAAAFLAVSSRLEAFHDRDRLGLQEVVDVLGG